MPSLLDINVRAAVAFALTIIAFGIVYIAIRLSDLKKLDRRKKK